MRYVANRNPIRRFMITPNLTSIQVQVPPGDVTSVSPQCQCNERYRMNNKLVQKGDRARVLKPQIPYEMELILSKKMYLMYIYYNPHKKFFVNETIAILVVKSWRLSIKYKKRNKRSANSQSILMR